jgi:2-oxoglutarate ferredoxin oxidoreductase subunit gamma
MNIRLAGFGGQGIVLAGSILGQASLLDGGNALQTQSYGSESRGGTCYSDVIITTEEILDFIPASIDVLVAMSQPALDRFLANLKQGGILIYDQDLVKAGDGAFQAFALPATDIAQKTFERDVVANVIMLGCLTALTGVVSHDSLRRAVADSVPPKVVDMNLEALEEGFKRGAAAAPRAKQHKRGSPRPTTR